MEYINELFSLMINQNVVRIIGGLDITRHSQTENELYTIKNIEILKGLKILSINRHGEVTLIDCVADRIIYDIPGEHIRRQYCLTDIEAKDFFYKWFDHNKEDSFYYDPYFEHNLELERFEIKSGYFKEDDCYIVFDFSYPLILQKCKTFDEARYLLKIDLEAKFFVANIFDFKTNSTIENFYFAVHNDEIIQFQKKIYEHQMEFPFIKYPIEQLFNEFLDEYIKGEFNVNSDEITEISREEFEYWKFDYPKLLELEQLQFTDFLKNNRA
ncbi:hypothetical protein [Paenimyroides viscosum]|uniref:Uncharacterized protein n=1 Tax=Paenimyroides viscosum TaxID=2488729 RepID=A0A3P1B311_9FLAO|nr:hypothetical protein [Paenimyroides viscosum]RRA95391.1 hypothetical protein EG242_05915 [Paenimyroides viscosum]